MGHEGMKSPDAKKNSKVTVERTSIRIIFSMKIHYVAIRAHIFEKCEGTHVIMESLSH